MAAEQRTVTAGAGPRGKAVPADVFSTYTGAYIHVCPDDEHGCQPSCPRTQCWRRGRRNYAFYAVSFASDKTLSVDVLSELHSSLG